MRKNNKGFTLVELLTVMVILAVLAAVSAKPLLGFIDKAKNAEAYEKAHLLIQAIAVCEAEHSDGDGMSSDVLTDDAFFEAPNQPSSVLYPYVGEETKDCTSYYVKFKRTGTGRYRISGFTYETESYTITWKSPSEIQVKRK